MAGELFLHGSGAEPEEVGAYPASHGPAGQPCFQGRVPGSQGALFPHVQPGVPVCPEPGAVQRPGGQAVYLLLPKRGNGAVPRIQKHRRENDEAVGKYRPGSMGRVLRKLYRKRWGRHMGQEGKPSRPL